MIWSMTEDSAFLDLIVEVIRIRAKVFKLSAAVVESITPLSFEQQKLLVASAALLPSTNS